MAADAFSFEDILKNKNAEFVGDESQPFSIGSSDSSLLDDGSMAGLDNFLGLDSPGSSSGFRKHATLHEQRVTVPLDNSDNLDSSHVKRTSNGAYGYTADNSASRNNKSARTEANQTTANHINKKPGRKLDPNMPMNKRKAQNRAAQRAFRERKEQHLKELEDRVDELEQEAAATIDENQILRLQVTRLQEELKSYKALHSLNDNTEKMTSAERSEIASKFAAGVNKSKRLPSTASSTDSVSFDFPFFAETAVQSKPKFDSIFSSSSSSNSDKATPSSGSFSAASSVAAAPSSSDKDLEKVPSHKSANSSITSPGSVIHDTDEFCEQLSWACGNSKSPVPKNVSDSTPVVDAGVMKWPIPTKSGQSPFDTTSASRRSSKADGKESLRSFQTSLSTVSPHTPSESEFSPSSFTADVLNDLANPLFEGDAFNISDYNTSDYTMFNPLENPIINNTFSKIADYNSQFQLKASALKSLEQSSVVDNAYDGELIPDDSSKFIGCEDVWDRLSSHPKFGDIDIESLCCELRTKAKCADTGAIISENDVNNAVDRLLASDGSKKIM